MKKYLLIIIIFLEGNNAYSQFIPVPSWGIKGGVNFADIGGEEADNALKTAFHLGAYGQKHFNSFWHMNLEILLSGQGHGARNDFDNKLNLLYLNLPLTVSYDPSFNFGFHAGFQPGLLLSAKSKFEEVPVDVKEQFHSIDLGLIMGASYYLMDRKLAINVRYVHGFTNLSKATDLVPDPTLRFNRVIQVSASYMIARLFDEE